jgi:hypothetical protein
VSNPTRYQGKPMLRLLECYTLHAIGSLGEKEEAALAAMTPKLHAIYKVEGTWREVIEKVMELPQNMPELICDMWTKNKKIAEENRLALAPQEFAGMFVDANLT